MKELIERAQAGEITPAEALKESLKHSTHIKDVTLDLTADILQTEFSGFDDNEYLIRKKGRLLVLAGLPGSGKTALAMQLAGNIAEHSRVLFFSFEMSKENLKERHLSVLSSIPLKKLRDKSFADKVKHYEAEQAKLHLSIIDNPGLTVNEAINKCFDEHRREPISAIIFDYLGLFEVDDARRPLEMGRVAEALKFRLAQKLNIPVIVLSQLNDEFERRYNQFLVANEKAKLFQNYTPIKNAIRPVLSDLAETRKLGRAADVVMFIHRPFLFDKSEPPSATTVFVAKNRNGGSKDFNLNFSGELTRFFNVEGF